jgi:sulfur carrier protein
VIELQVNGAPLALDDPATVESLVEVLECGRRGVAVAVNSTIVARSAWTRTILVTGDVVEVLTAAQGG